MRFKATIETNGQSQTIFASSLEKALAWARPTVEKHGQIVKVWERTEVQVYEAAVVALPKNAGVAIEPCAVGYALTVLERASAEPAEPLQIGVDLSYQVSETAVQIHSRSGTLSIDPKDVPMLMEALKKVQEQQEVVVQNESGTTGS